MTESGRSPNITISPKIKGIENTSNLLGKKGFRKDLLLISLLLLFFFKEPLTSNNGTIPFIHNFFVPSFSTEFLTFTDIESLGYILYLGFPFITILIGILLWCVLIGILRISGQ
jgi:hypothetical protein